MIEIQSENGKLKYIDIHTHKRSSGNSILDISDGRQPVAGEWCSVGMHPMFLKESIDTVAIDEMAKLGQIVAIGEAGMDRNSAVEMKEQLQLFERQVQLSENYRLPLIIHCVRAFPELLALKKSLRPQVAWIVHGYNNNAHILEQLLSHDCCIAAGKKLFAERSNIRELLPTIPLSSLFLETDDSDYRIEEVYRQASLVSGHSVEKLQTEIAVNFKRCFPALELR